MNVFVNDYNDVAHPAVLEKMLAMQEEANVGYGFDEHCENARRILREKLKSPEALIHFLPGGTITNILALTGILKPFEAIVAPETGHIVEHEVGAPEAFGHKVITIPTSDGKLTVEGLEEVLKNYGSFYNVLPKIVYVSNTTELGTVYTKSELKNIYEYCLEKGYYLYIDGARLASAMTAPSGDLVWEDFSEICDAFSIGGTKDGALFGESLVFFNPEMEEGFIHYMKQRGVLMAKGFLLGVQFEALLEGENELYLQNAKIANDMAEYLAEEWKQIGGKFLAKPESNQVFLIVKRAWLSELEKNNMFEEDEEIDEEHITIRLVTTYRTKKEEIDSFIEEIKELKK